MKEDNQQMSDFEYQYIQAYTTQFDVFLGQNFLHNNAPKLQNNYSHLRQLFFPSNRTEKKQQQIKEKYTQFDNNRIFFYKKYLKQIHLWFLFLLNLN